MRRPELRGVAPENPGDAAKPERLDIVAQQRARLDTFVNEQRIGRAARDRLDAERAGAGKKIEDARAGDGVAVRMGEDVE